jgi:hypothetical protein
MTTSFFSLQGLLEAMEQQQVSIAKAGIVASLPARCSVLAAANPKNGSYNMGKSVAENLNMAKPILSRFDLVFILRDRADKEQDQHVSSSIIDLYRSQNRTKSSAKAATAVTPSISTEAHVAEGISGDPENHRLPLPRRLAWVHEFQKVPLPAALVRDYIAYAREFCKPKLTPEAATVLKDYFMKLRYVSGRSSVCPARPPFAANRSHALTLRRLFGKIYLAKLPVRLLQARARHRPHHNPAARGADQAVPSKGQGVPSGLLPEGGRLGRCGAHGDVGRASALRRIRRNRSWSRRSRRPQQAQAQEDVYG